MKRLVLAGLLCPAIFFAPAVCRAQEVELKNVVVTGTRTKRKITEVPAAIGVVTKEELKQSRGWNVGEVLESIAGVQSQTKGGGYGYDTHIIIRGAGAKAAYGVRGIMIMVDGIPITDPDSLKGVEVSGRVQLLKGLYFGGSYAYSDFTLEKFEETTKGITYSRDGNRLQLVPMHQYSFSLDYRHSNGVSAKVSTNTWRKYYVDAANSEAYKEFTVVNAKLGYDWEQFSFFFRVDNVSDKKYAAEVSKSYGVTSYSPAAPRTWTAGVNYQF